MEKAQRQIKFRAWDTKRKEMINPGWWGVQSETGLAFENEANYLPFNGEEIIMQFTGLKDENGKEIYEGDIVKVLDRDWSDAEKDTKILIVYFHHGTFELVSKEGIEELEKENPDIYNKKWLTARIYKEYGRDGFEIIGNIYSNPELLK